jgi:hypothetical protein
MGIPWESPQASLIPWPKALPRLVARRCAVRRPEAGRVAVHGAAGGVAGVVAARQGGPGSHLHLGEVGEVRGGFLQFPSGFNLPN